MQNALAEKVIVVVGGTTGLGLAGARACVAAGARVVVVGRDPQHAEEAVASLGPASRAALGDATQAETSDRAIALAVEAFGRFDGLYHVAGGSGRRFGDAPLHEITDEGWQQTLRWNLDSLFYSNRAATRQLLRQGTGGAILNMGSVLAEFPSPGHFSTHAYTAAKSAVLGLSRAAAAYYARRDIRFNVIAPGLVETPMSRRAQEDAAIMSFIHSKQPLDTGRIGRPEDLDGAVVYFLSDASRFVTGQVHRVDGGWSVSDAS